MTGPAADPAGAGEVVRIFLDPVAGAVTVFQPGFEITEAS